MKINWNENPLMTTVDLDEHDKKILWYETMIEQMHWQVVGAHFHLTRKDEPEIEEALRDLAYESHYNEEGDTKGSPLHKRCDELVEYYVEALQGPHVGDCTCVAASCDKCHAEDLLGINTIKGLGKHEAVKIHSAFGEYMRPWKRKRTLNQVIEYLENYDAARKPPKWDGWEAHVGRWNAEAKDACEWLKSYKDQHFSDR